MKINKETRPLIYIAVALGVLWAIGILLDRSVPQPAASTATPAKSSKPQGVIVGQMVIGCPSATGLTELDKYRALGNEASYKVLRDSCYAFNSGDRVTITSTDDFTRTVQIHKQGDFFDYWVHAYDVVMR